MPVKNIARLGQAGDALTSRAEGLPGMGLVYGPAGYGKTFGCSWLRNRCDGIYIRALAVWTPTDMLAAICGELGEPPGGRLALMMDRIISRLRDRPRPLMIDEADYIVDSKRMVESLRDLHDQSTAPVILIGMQGIEQRIKGRRQLTGRLLQWVGFRPADLEDVEMMARYLCEVEVEAALLDLLHRDTGGSARLVVVGLTRIEALGKARGISPVTLAAWLQQPKDQQRFFFGDASPCPTKPKD